MSDHGGEDAVDLRLVPAAAAAWCAAAWAQGDWAGDLSRVPVAMGLAAVAVAGLLTIARWRSGGGLLPVGRAPLWRTVAASAGLALLAVLVVLAVVTARQHAPGTDTLRGLVDERAVVQVVGVVRADPVTLVSPWQAPGGQPSSVATSLDLVSVTGRGVLVPVRARLDVVGGPGWAELAYGTVVVATGRLDAPRAGSPAGAALTASGVRPVSGPSGVQAGVAALRQGLVQVTDPLEGDARGLVPGMAVGDTSRVPTELTAAMRDTGLLHLTAVSGAHFAVLTLAVLGLATALRLPRAVRVGVAVLVGAGFVLLVHPEPSVLRAAVMGGIGALGMVVGRPSRSSAALPGAVLGLLVLEPGVAGSLGFTLSVTATAAIVLAGRPLADQLAAWVPRWLAVAVAVPTVAQLACGPVLLLVQPDLPVLAVPANVLVAPAVAPATLLGLAALLTAGWAPWLATTCAELAALPAAWIAGVARVGAGLPASRMPWPDGPAGALALVVATTLLVLGWRTVAARFPARDARS